MSLYLVFLSHREWQKASLTSNNNNWLINNTLNVINYLFILKNEEKNDIINKDTTRKIKIKIIIFLFIYSVENGQIKPKSVFVDKIR